MNYVFDTNILIDYLNGIPSAMTALEQCQKPIISRITWIEVMVGTNETNKVFTENFLKQFNIIEITQSIAVHSIQIRQTKRIKLPDALILATAKQLNVSLVTRNTKDFSENENGIIIPYTL